MGVPMTDVFLCAFKRTPIGRYGGSLAITRPDDLAAAVIDGLLGTHDLPIDEVIFGIKHRVSFPRDRTRHNGLDAGKILKCIYVL